MNASFLDMLTQLESKYQWASVEVDGYEWRWIDTGSIGPVAILLPGSVGDGAMYVATLRALGDRLRLIAMTYPALSDPTILARGLAQVMTHLGLDRSAIAGSSFAAYWIQFFALYYPSRIQALIIGNGFTDGDDLAENSLFDRTYIEGIDSATLHAEWLGRVRKAPASELQKLQETMLAQRQSADNLHSRFLGVVHSAPCPSLSISASDITILDCDDDPLIPPAARARLRDRYPEAHHVSFKHGGHYPHLLNPEAYEELLLRCVNGA